MLPETIWSIAKGLCGTATGLNSKLYRNILYESRIPSIIDKFGSQLFCLRSGLTQKIISQ